ncbi:BadF/BadG/BcrA/BcrD ATPase family protein [Kineococcus sp. SYSU DK001]|uniref:BadF/BadG/BcrA/BcrD ATPase family protein n=1 Tax=Kineococcus sp. SYSU DK001 TaxID=3383122 RepID=UPI003D7CCA76
MTVLLALDAGGSTTRALVLDLDGYALGRAAAGPGNPTAVGVGPALAELRTAAHAALAAAGRRADDVAATVLATAGSDRLVGDREVADHLGLPRASALRRVPDLLAMFHSAAGDADGTDDGTDDGAVLVVGTGAVAARVRDGDLARVAGGNGWLLGDPGSGFWIGRRVARAAAADLDGTGPATALTAAVLAAFGLPDDRRVQRGRALALPGLVDAVHAAAPVRLARLAPLCPTAARAGDAVAAGIVTAAGDELAVLVRAVTADLHPAAPLVVGGGVWRHVVGPAPAGALARALRGRAVVPADDGLRGAAVLALRLAGRPAVRPRAAAAPPARP